LLAGCAGATEPAAPVTGTYHLATVDGAALPGTIWARGGDTTRVLAGTLEIRPNGYTARSHLYHAVYTATLTEWVEQAGTWAETTPGRLRLDGNTTAILSGRAIEVAWDRAVYVYRR
jgi:hypothetical protein